MIFGIALTIIALSASATATGYTDGREYVYHYKGIIFSGFPRIKPQQSGYEYDSRLRIQPAGDHAIFKIDQASKASFNGEYEDPYKASHEYEDLPSHADFLTRPFRVYRKNGIVTHFEVYKDEPSFSVNIKRGLASLFSLNLDQVESEPSIENNIFKTDPHAHYYKIYEDTLLGECETAYVIEHHPYDLKNNIVLNVTKVRNFHKCKTRPNQVYSVFYGRECGEVDHEKSHTLHGNSEYHYSIRGNRHDYIIENIRTESDIAYTPYPMKGQTVSTIIKRSLELVEEKPVTQTIEMSDNLVDLTSFVYDFDFQKDFREFVDLKMPHYLYHLTGRKAPMDDIRNQMEQLVNLYNDESYAERIRDKEFPSKFVELLRSVSTVGYDEIEDLYKTYADIPDQEATEEQKQYRNLFIDTLVNLGTNPAFLFGKYLVENDKLTSLEALHFVQQLQYHIKEVSETLLDNLQELCDHNNVKKDSTIHVACIFTLSNIVFDHCVAQYHPDGIHEGKNVCPYDAATKYFNYIARLYEETQDEKLKYNYVKAAGNIGVKEIIPYLEPYVMGHGNVHTFHRENAIWALKNVGHRYPQKVRTLLFPLLFNRTENYELRLASFLLLLHMKPELYEIEGMARNLKNDPDDQVRIFVYSTFKTLSNSTHICDRKISKDAKYAVRILEDVHKDLEQPANYYSFIHNHYFAGYDPDYDFGGSTRFAYFASDTGYIPRMLYLGFTDYIGGKHMKTFGFGIKQFGLEKFIDKIFGPEGSFGHKSLFDFFKKRDKRDTSGIKTELNEIKEKLNIPIHDYEDIQADIFFKFMGNQICSFQLDEKTFEDFFKDGRFVIPDIPAVYQKMSAFAYQRFLMNVDKMYVIPTESGIPLFFDYKQPLYYYHKNRESSFRVEPGFFPEDRGGEYPDHVKIETDGHFALDKHLVAYMGVVIPFDQVIFGAGINERSTLSLPLKVKLDLVIKEKKLKTHWTPVAPHEIFHFKYEPFTFMDSYANSVPQILEKGYLPVKKVHRHELTKRFFHDALGIGFDLQATYENEFNDFGSWADFFLKKNYWQKFYYMLANPNFEPYDVNVQLTYAGQDATKEVETDISYNFHDSDWIIPHFSEENFEHFDNQDVNGPFLTSTIKSNIIAKGDRERKLHAVASWIRNFKFVFHKINFYYERNPFTQKETENFKVCGSSYLKYPKMDGEKMDALDTVDMDAIVNTEFKVHFGENCNSDQKIKIQGQISRSDESLELERRREEPDTPEHYNPFSYHYKEAMKELERGININGHSWKYINLVKLLDKYAFHIKHENLSPGFLNKTYLLDRVLKFMYYTHSDHNEIDVHNPVDEVHIEANFSFKLPLADFRIQKPLSNSNYKNIFMPSYTGIWSYPLVADAAFLNNYCTIEGDNYLYTFDRYEYTLPDPLECWKLMAKDCSPNEYFTVLVKKVDHPKYTKALKIFLADHKIEFFPEADKSKLTMNLDDKQVDLASIDGPYQHREGKDNDLIFHVSHGGSYVTLHSAKYGVHVEHFGDTITVFASRFYRSKTCGLCGNYNDQKHDESKTKNGCYYATDKDFAYSYSIPSETCSIHKQEPICP